jgi:MFS family permease
VRQAIGFSSLGAGISYSNLAIGLPLLALAEGKTALLAGSLIALNTIAISVGALSALALRRPEAGVAYGLLLIGSGSAILVLPPSNATMALGAFVHGAGHGLFWVGVQGGLGRRSGQPGSERSFVLQYSMYVGGTVVGGVLTGVGVAAVRSLGADKGTAICLTFLVGAVGSLLAVPAVVSWLRQTTTTTVARPRLTLVRGLALQMPDLFLVGAMGMLVSLAPVVLSEVFRLPPFTIGLTGGLMAIAKIVGSFAAGRLARLTGARITVGGMLGASSVSAALLIGVDGAVLYIALTVSAVFFGIGAWPIIVDGALARVWPADRARITIAWNVREYTAIALTTVVGGYLLDVFTGPAILLGFAATLLGCAALSALIVLRAPMHPPAEPQDAQARVGIA